MKFCKTAAMQNIRKINTVKEVMQREIKKPMIQKNVHFRGKMMAEKTGICHCFTYNISDFSRKPGIQRG